MKTNHGSIVLALLMSIPLLSCSVATKQKIMEPALRDAERRHETFEATLRILDEHPKYVDEFYVLAQKHPKTMERFVVDTTKNLKDPRLAHMTGQHLAENPPSLRQVMIATLDASSGKPEAEQAVADAIIERPDQAATAIASRPEAVRVSTRALLVQVGKNGGARSAFLAAMTENREMLAQLLVNNPKTAKALAGSTIKAEAKKVFGSDDKPKKSNDKDDKD